ncbi:hypothetical protein [Amycolatopsis vastitatis]|uniref:hypothetical protein n=1 Tax=Amycolatopsis vastitatis TaxID=1905142 RepID=UPI001F0A1398|nr:hypothetical protein [Amycolatopsis vastitatis]
MGRTVEAGLGSGVDIRFTPGIRVAENELAAVTAGPLWAGHSVAVLHEVYAKVLAGLEEESLGKIARILGLLLDDDEDSENMRPS